MHLKKIVLLQFTICECKCLCFRASYIHISKKDINTKKINTQLNVGNLRVRT